MFAPLGLFKGIACPEGEDCKLVTCVFSHQAKTEPKEPRSDQLSHAVTDTLHPQEPAQKRRKVGHNGQASAGATRPQTTAEKRHVIEKRPQQQELGDLHSVVRGVSPPAKPRPKQEATAKPAKDGPSARKRNVPKESLNPRMLMKAPASHSVRSLLLQKLHAAMSALNAKMAGLKDREKSSLVLSPDELIVMALDEEQKAAAENPSVYGNVVKLRIVKLQKMSLDDWAKEVLAHLNARYYKVEAAKPGQETKKFTTGMQEEEEIAICRMLRTELKGKEQFGYITSAPTEKEIEQAKSGIDAAQGWEKCDRCAGRFQVFPGRREDGALATGGHCTYHPGKIIRPARKATDHITGQADAYYPCCNESVGTSAGCSKAEHHVFKVSEAKRLAAVLPFEHTPAHKEGEEPRKPVTFDCEMAYTTLGMELVRLTALSWPAGEMLVDVLVKPLGEILDLNSRYSGIFPEHYAKAVPYGTPLPQSTPAKDGEDSRGSGAPMEVVDSPAAARALLFEFVDADTPLIGHAIDNDLNATRIIHPTVIDTVLLYPHPRGLPIRHSLKHLARLHLERDIQMGGNKGHDSKEDALATGDLVRHKVVEKAKILKRAGWSFKRTT